MSQERITELEAEVRYHNDQYHNGMPEVTDAEFDEFVDELRTLDPDSPALAEVGALPSWGRKVKHPSVMGSLEKVTEGADLLKWLDKYGTADTVLLAAPKIDGLAVRLRYADGKLVEAATRGDGQVGQDVLENAKQIDTIPHDLPGGFTGEVRGEVYMRKDVWKSFGGQFANPRNGAAGGLLQKDSTKTAERKLSFIAYKADRDDSVEITEQRSRANTSGMGFDFVELEVIEVVHLDAYLAEWENSRRAALPFNIDGLVFSLNSFEEQEEAGWNGKRPRGKVAWKFKPEQREANVFGVDWQVGRTGKLTPVLRIDPTHVDGSTISNISLHSLSRFNELALGRGDKVLIEKAGDIIPQVVRVTWRPLSNEKLKSPTECPSCNALAEVDGAHLRCSNPVSCPAQLERRILFWLQMMDVKGAGTSVVAGMCTTGTVKVISDLYYLDSDQLTEVTGSRAIADKVLNEILLKSEMPLWRMLAGLGISGLGRTTGKLVTKKFGTIEEVKNVTVEELEVLDGIGPETARKIVVGLFKLKDEIDALAKVLEIEVPVTGGVLTGKSFCLTGAMSRKRGEIAADIEAAGGDVKSSVGKGLTYLVQADATSESSKTKKAAKFGTEVISEETLMELMA